MKHLPQGLSKLLLMVGAVVFLFGDKALEEFWHFKFATGELMGIGCGVALMFAGAAIQLAFPKAQRKGGDTGTV
ncbi:MAG TPA: hypothetical protein VJS11_09745 [Acidobacteriaceae bacterium]|nr:hypothetical protein [Acidobacteriaceae bacterium]